MRLQPSQRTVKDYGFINISSPTINDDIPINLIVGFNLVHPFTHVRSTPIKALKLDQQKNPLIAFTASGSEYTFKGPPVNDFRELEAGIILIERTFGIDRLILMSDLIHHNAGSQGVSIEDLGKLISDSEDQANKIIDSHIEQILDEDRVIGIIIRKSVKIVLIDPVTLSESLN